MPQPDKNRSIVIRKRELYLYLMASIYTVALATIALVIFFDFSYNKLLPMVMLLLMASVFPFVMMFYRTLVRGETYQTTFSGEKVSADSWKEMQSKLLKNEVKKSSRVWILNIRDPFRFFPSQESFLDVVRQEYRDVKILLLDPSSKHSCDFPDNLSKESGHENFLDEAAKLLGPVSSLEVRYYTERPLFSLLVLDDQVFAAFHPEDISSHKVIYRFQGKENDLRKLFYSNYLWLWKHGEVVDMKRNAQQTH